MKPMAFFNRKTRPRLANQLAACWMLIALLLMLGAPVILLNDAVQLALLPMAAFALIALLDKNFRLRQLFCGPDGSIRLMALVFTALYFVFLSIPNLFNAPLFSEGGLSVIWWQYRWQRLIYLVWNWTGFFIGYLLSVYGCFYYAFHRALNNEISTEGEPLALAPDKSLTKIKWLRLYPAILPLALICICLIYASTPSLFIGDAPSVWYGVRDSLWSQWHTAGYMLFVKLCTLLWNNQRMVTLVQMVCCIYIHNYGLTRLINAGASRRACYGYILLAIISFVPLYFLQAIIKDVVFALALTAFGMGVLRMATEPQKPKPYEWLFLGFFGLCTCLFRHAGVLPVAAGLIGLAIYFIVKRSKRFVGCLVTGACVALCSLAIVNVLANRVMGFEQNPGYIAFSAPMTMIGAVAASDEPIDAADLEVMERIMPREKWAQCYSPYFADSISRPYGAIGEDIYRLEAQNLGGELIHLNARFLFTHTKTYVKAFFDLNSLMWELATPADGYVRSYLGYPVTSISDFVTQQGYGEDGITYISKELKQAEDTTFTGLAPLVNRYAELLYGWPVTRCLFWRGGFANLAMLFAAVLLIKKRRANGLLALLPIGAATLGMLFSVPAQEVRYVFANLLWATFYLAYGLGAKPLFEKEQTY